MNVVYHSSDFFAPTLGVSMASLFENNKEAQEINVYIIENGIAEENRKKLMSLGDDYGRNIAFIPMPDINAQKRLGLKKVKNKWMFDSFCRLYLADLLPDTVHRVLYLDCDILIVAPLFDLWHVDLKGCSAGAVADALPRQYYSLLSIVDQAHYCNSGVILFDLDRLRAHSYDDEIRRYIQEHDGYVFFMEQTVFNAVWKNDICLLPARYNLMSIMTSLSYDQILMLRKPVAFHMREEISAALEAPCIFHMTSAFFEVNRPWIQNTTSSLKNVFLQYQRLTPWKDIGLSSDTRSLRKKLADYAVQHTPKSILMPIVSIVYNTIRVGWIKMNMRKAKADSYHALG